MRSPTPDRAAPATPRGEENGGRGGSIPAAPQFCPYLPTLLRDDTF
jgi:hypothetical protein